MGGRFAATALLTAILVQPLTATGARGEPLQVFVSVLPQKFLAERVAGGRAEVHAMVGPGQSPHTYEPSPRQMAGLAAARLYFRIGVSFEGPWMAKIRSVNPSMGVVDCREGLPGRPLEGRGEHGAGESHLEETDPHIWTDPLLAARIAVTMKKALAALDPAGAGLYEENCRRLTSELTALDAEIRRMLAGVRRRRFMVLHPSWGYFADAYGLEQVAIERRGGEPGARELAAMIDEARREGTAVVFVQPQSGRRSAEAVAEAVGGRVVSIDPLAGDCIAGLRSAAALIAEALR